MTGYENEGMMRSKGNAISRGVRLTLVLVFLATSFVSVSCGAQPDGKGNANTAEPPETTSSAAGTGNTAGGTSGDEMGTTSGGAFDEGEAGEQLILAAGSGDAERVERLLNEGADVDTRDASSRTALVAAAYGNHLGVAELLVGAGADVNQKDDTEQSAYLISTSEVGDDPRLLEMMLENGADVRSLDSYDGTGLIRAADRGHVRIVEELLETGTDVDHVNNLGWTALLEAIILGGGDERHTEVVRLLVEEGGADPNLPDGEGIMPLGHARENGYAEMVRILEGAGAR